MAYTYTAWSVVFGEQPSAAKWNQLGTNDSSFDERIGDGFSSGTTSPIWWEELGRDTLSSAGDTISVASLGARDYLKILVYTPISATTVVQKLRFNNDSGSNYAYRVEGTTGTYASATSADHIALSASSSNSSPMVATVEVFNNESGTEKILHAVQVHRGASGAGTAVEKRDIWGKWANTSAQITRVDVINDGTGDFSTGAEVVVLGHD